MNHPTPAAGSIIVGIDDSPQSRTALRWAADLARSSGRHLEAVHVNPYDSLRSPVWAGTLPALVAGDDAQADDRNRLRIVAMYDDVAPAPGWDLAFLDGPVGAVLVERSRGAQLLVVGTGEHHGVDRLLSGSISRYCLTHAAVAVAAVPTVVDAVPADAHPLAAADHLASA
jgi:nucleotide-binding universal stress UspA family protein